MFHFKPHWHFSLKNSASCVGFFYFTEESQENLSSPFSCPYHLPLNTCAIIPGGLVSLQVVITPHMRSCLRQKPKQSPLGKGNSSPSCNLYTTVIAWHWSKPGCHSLGVAHYEGWLCRNNNTVAKEQIIKPVY